MNNEMMAVPGDGCTWGTLESPNVRFVKVTFSLGKYFAPSDEMIAIEQERIFIFPLIPRHSSRHDRHVIHQGVKIFFNLLPLSHSGKFPANLVVARSERS